MQTAILTACGLLGVGFILRAKVRLLQFFFVPAAVAGGLVGLILFTFLCPYRLSLDIAFVDDLNRGVLSPALRGALRDGGFELSQEAVCLVQQHGRRWRIDDVDASLAVLSGKKRLNVHGIHLGVNAAAVMDVLRTWPGWLISVIFACLLLNRTGKSLGRSLGLAVRQANVVWIIILGQIAIGLLATWLLILPVEAYRHVPGSFGQLIEVGFAGGHGTAAAMGDVFSDWLDFPEGKDLGFFFATAGLIYGVVSGIVFVNLAVRRGWTRAGRTSLTLLGGLEARRDPVPVALGRVRSEVIDPLVFQVMIVAGAFLVGVGLHAGVMAVVPRAATVFGADEQTVLKVAKFAGNMPLFMFTLMGGLLVREFMHLVRIGDLIDVESVRRITGAAVEFLIVAAIASMNLAVLYQFGWPVLLLLVLGFAWTGVCLMGVSRWLLPSAYWFELGVLNYGMSTGTTAQGMMLLRIVDKDLASGAAEDYALAAPLSAPFIGGGVITLVALPWALKHHHIGLVVAVLALAMAMLLAVGVFIARADRRGVE